jgi:hypothetical protein
MRSWVLMSWPEVHWELPVEESNWPVFQHMGTHVRGNLEGSDRLVGETVWAARLDADRVLGAAWEWMELRPGVAVICDPNGIISNGSLLDANGETLAEASAIVGLTRIACTIPWQGVVARAARGEVVEAAEMPGQARRLADRSANERKAGMALLNMRRARTRRAPCVGVAAAAALAA